MYEESIFRIEATLQATLWKAVNKAPQKPAIIILSDELKTVMDR